MQTYRRDFLVRLATYFPGQFSPDVEADETKPSPDEVKIPLLRTEQPIRRGVFYPLLLWLLSSETKDGRRYGNPWFQYRNGHRRHSRSLWFLADILGLVLK
jgi:hypothetical protein